MNTEVIMIGLQQGTLDSSLTEPRLDCIEKAYGHMRLMSHAILSSRQGVSVLRIVSLVIDIQRLYFNRSSHLLSAFHYQVL